MASSLCGQAALLPLPKKAKKNKVTLANTVLPCTLQVDRHSLKTNEGEGIHVFKVSKVSKTYSTEGLFSSL
jgi:hypothetical protein